MDREELLALQTALEAVLNWPPAVRAEVARWLSHDVASNGLPGEKRAKESNSAQDRTAPNEAPKPNGRDRHPPTRQAKPAQSKFNAKTIELRLLQALRDNLTSMTAAALARATGAALTTTSVRLKALGERGEIEKDAAGLWRLAGEAVGPTSQGADVGPIQPSAAAG